MNIQIINKCFEREKQYNEIRQILIDFDKNKNNIAIKKGIYIYGSSGIGKTEFVKNILTELDFDIIQYDAGDVRNKALIENIASNNISTCNVLDMMRNKVRKIAIVMDEIDGMNNGDKGGISALIKLIRQKKTKKQKMENMTLNPIICIGNYNIDKKIKELMKVCHVFEFSTPKKDQILKYISTLYSDLEATQKNAIVEYVNGDLRKLKFIDKLYRHDKTMIKQSILSGILNTKSFNDDTNKITKSLLSRQYNLSEHGLLMNETDRTTVALLWHENIVDIMPTNIMETIDFYLSFLENTCFADYIDRITFQNQIWQFNEMSSLIKTFYNNRMFHKRFKVDPAKIDKYEVRFTKVLTKYSTEYNNIGFIYELCQKLDMDKKDLIAFFQEMRLFYENYYNDCINNIQTINSIEKMFDTYEINKLDIRRIYRYLDHNVKKDTVHIDDDIEYDDE